MYIFGSEFEQIQLLIDKIHHNFTYHYRFLKFDYDKLLTISEQVNYFYGQAFAHVYLARYFLTMHDEGMYQFHLCKAKDLADAHSYFDILIEYDKLEGLRNIYNGKEIAALSFYLQGKKSADLIKDRKSAAVFYGSIAELFCRNCSYEEAEKHYSKALEILADASQQPADYYRCLILARLLHLSCLWGRREKAEQYLETCISIPCDNEIVEILTKQGAIHLFLLKEQYEEAEHGVEGFMELLKTSSSDLILLLPVYADTIDLLFRLKKREEADWCLKRLSEQVDNVYPNMAVRIKKLQIEYLDVFGCDNDSIYKSFYETVQISETAARASTAQIFNNMIFLYETDKQKNHMTKLRSDLQEAVDTDELTGVYNRRYYSKILSKLIQDDRLTSLGSVMVDVDYFKEYNDCYGHPSGDEVLKTVASMLKNNLPAGAYAARYGGDEFICLFPKRSEEEMVSYVRAVRKDLRKQNIPHIKSRCFDMVTLSFGIYYESELSGCDESDFIKKADEALYQAKKQGRNTYAIYGQGRQR